MIRRFFGCLLLLIASVASFGQAEPLTRAAADLAYQSRGWVSPYFPYVNCATNPVYQDGQRSQLNGSYTGPDNYRTRHVATVDVSEIRIKIGNWYSAGTGSSLCTYVGNTFTVDLTVERISPSGATTEDQARMRGTVGGGLTRSITFPTFSTNVITDPITISLKKGEIFYIRWSISGSANQFYPNGGAVLGGTGNGVSRGNGEGLVLNSASRIDPGGANIGGTGSQQRFGPLAILGKPITAGYVPSIAGLTDSIGVNTSGIIGDGTVPYRRTYIGIAADAMPGGSIPYLPMGVGGTKLSDWENVNNTYQRVQVIATAPVVVFALGTNDLGSSTSTMMTNALRIGTRVVQRGQKMAVAPIIPRTSSTNGWQTVASQAFLSNGNEHQRRVWNNWLPDTTGSVAVTDEIPQAELGGSTTIFYTRYPISGSSVTATLNGTPITAPTVSDGSLGQITFGSAPGAGTLRVSYTKQAGYFNQIAAVAPYGAEQLRYLDLLSLIEVHSDGTAWGGWQSNGTYKGGFWKASDGQSDSGTATGGGSNTISDTSKTGWTLDQYAGHVLRVTSGTAAYSPQTQGIMGNNRATLTTLIFPLAWSTNPSSGDTYIIYRGHTVDGIHPSGYGHTVMSAAFTPLRDWILSKLPGAVALNRPAERWNPVEDGMFARRTSRAATARRTAKLAVSRR